MNPPVVSTPIVAPVAAPKPPKQSLYGCLTSTLTTARSCLAFSAPLVTRLVLGLVFCVSGMNKILSLETLSQSTSTQEIAFTMFDAVFLGCMETAGGVLLMVGLGTRAVAAFFFILSCVRLVTTERGLFFSAITFQGRIGLMSISAFTSALLFLWLILYGPGVVSFDALNAWVVELWRKQKKTV